MASHTMFCLASLIGTPLSVTTAKYIPFCLVLILETNHNVRLHGSGFSNFPTPIFQPLGYL